MKLEVGAIGEWTSRCRVRIASCAAGAALAALAAVATAGCGGGSAALIVYEAKGGDNVTNVWTIDPASGASTQITRGTSFDGNPGWSPDHKQIAFISDRDRGGHMEDIYIARADGSDARRITTSTGSTHNWSPKFSPDGKQIAYVTVEGGRSYYVSLMNVDGTNQRRITDAYKFAEFPAWTRDGSLVYFSAIGQDKGDPDLYSVDVRTYEARTRVSTPAADVCPHFTHDGKTLTYASVAPGQESGGNVDLFAHDLTSGTDSTANDQRLTTDPSTDDYGNPSPDDKSIVFITHRDGNGELYLMDRDGGNQRRLTNTPDIDENVPDW